MWVVHKETARLAPGGLELGCGCLASGPENGPRAMCLLIHMLITVSDPLDYFAGKDVSARVNCLVPLFWLLM